MIYNYWVGLRNNAHAQYREYVNWPEETPYTGPLTPETIAIMDSTHDWDNVQRQYKLKGSGANAFWFYSIYLDLASDAEMQAAMQQLETQWSTAAVDHLGVWHWDGARQDQFVTWDEANVLNYMPPVTTYDQDGNPISTDPATEVVDVNMLLGQSPRDFS